MTTTTFKSHTHMMKNGGVNEDQLAQCYIHLSTHKLFICINKYLKILRENL